MLILIPIFLLILGLIAIIVESFIPDAGITAIFGISMIIAAVVFSFLKLGTITGLIFFSIALIASPTSFILAFKMFPKSYFGKKIILTAEENKEKGFSAATEDMLLKDQIGITVTNCRPIGIAIFGNKKYDVITQGEFIEKDTKVKVINIEGSKIIIKKAIT